MKTQKKGLQVQESSAEHKGRKYPAMASGGSLPEGLSHQKSAGDVDGMYKRDEKKQRAPKGHDRI